MQSKPLPFDRDEHGNPVPLFSGPPDPSEPWYGRFPVAAAPPARFITKSIEVWEQRLPVQRARLLGMRWFAMTFIATRRGEHRFCVHKACRRKRACIGQRPPNPRDSIAATTPPCLSISRANPNFAVMHEATKTVRQLMLTHGVTEGLRLAKRIWFGEAAREANR